MGIGARGLAVCSAVAFLWVSGCGGARQPTSVPRESASTASPRDGAAWVLVRNPRFGDVRGEPEYVWVEEDRLPITLRTILFGQNSIIAPPEVVARHGPPPQGGAISRLHGGLIGRGAAGAPPPPAERKPEMRAVAQVPSTRSEARGYVVLVRKPRIIVDLTERDGLAIGSLLSIRQPVPVVHPVTGQLLGDYEDEVATARVLEIQEKFSVAEIEEVGPGVEVKPKDRVQRR